MIIRLNNFLVEKGEGKEESPSKNYVGKLRINWVKPDLAEDVEHYDDKAKIEFYQHNITIGNRDIGKVGARSTKFYKYIIEPFKKGKMIDFPVVSDDGFNISNLQNLMPYEFDNIVNGAYGKAYGDVLVKIADSLKGNGSIQLPAPIIIRFINFGETRTSAEDSFYLLSGNRRINLALQYNIPVKAWVIDLIPSRRDLREFIEKSGASKEPEKLMKLVARKTGKDNIEDLNARERFTLIQSLKNF